MAYGDNITEKIPVPIGNPTANQYFNTTGVAYDIAIGGVPFFLLNDDNTPYRRVTAQYKKQQVDMSREPGEQTLTSWWLRSQSSFHSGAGINFYDPSAGETVLYRFNESKGVNVWTKGQVTLLRSCTQSHATTGEIGRAHV